MNEPGIGVDVGFDKTVHSKSSLLRVAYAMADRIALELHDFAERYVLRGTATSEADAFGLADEIRICAADFALREEIEGRTAGMRDLIWRAAFAEAAGTTR